MAKPIDGQFTARIEGDFVVFLIGMRINRPWKPWQWLPAFLAMPKMLKELKAAGPSSGFLGHTPLSLTLIAQYWRSFEDLERYARSRDNLHFPAWTAFNRRIKGKRGDVGLWHETYLVRAGEYECVYTGMPPFGLSAAAELVRFGQGGVPGARERLTAR